MSQPPSSPPETKPVVVPRAAASLAVFKDREVLLVRRAKPPVAGLWSLPGGHVEPGETAMAAAIRELAEETSCTARDVRLADIHDVILRDETGCVTRQFMIAVHAGVWESGVPVAGDDADEAQFVSLDALGQLEMTASAREIIERAAALLGI
ncbi:MAG: NUDIX hydrolase [Pseudomonadota bacterium]